MNYKMKKMYGGTKKKMMQKGGAKPDYLDMDKDGNKTESMKSAVASKKKMQMGGMSKGPKIKGTGTLTNTDSKGNVTGATNAVAQANKAMNKEKASEKTMSKGGVRRKKKGTKPASKKVKSMGMGGSKMMKYQAGGFLEPPVYDLDA